MELTISSDGVPSHASDSSRVPTWVVFSAAVVLEAAIAWGANHLLLTRELVMAVSGGQLDTAQAERMLQLSERFQWLGYLATLPSVLVRFALVALVLQFAILFFESSAASFASVFRIAAIAHLAKIAESLFGLLWFLHIDESGRTAAFFAGNPLSLTVFVDREGPLGAVKTIADSLSVGNAAWILVVIWLVANELRRPKRSLVITCVLAWAAMLVVRFTLYQTLTAISH